MDLDIFEEFKIHVQLKHALKWFIRTKAVDLPYCIAFCTDVFGILKQIVYESVCTLLHSTTHVFIVSCNDAWFSFIIKGELRFFPLDLDVSEEFKICAQLEHV